MNTLLGCGYALTVGESFGRMYALFGEPRVGAYILFTGCCGLFITSAVYLIRPGKKPTHIFGCNQNRCRSVCFDLPRLHLVAE